MQVHSCFAAISSRDVYIVRKLDLPFTPFFGLQLSDGEWSAQLTEIVWDVQKQQWECYVEPDKELYNAGLHRTPNPRTLEEIVKEWEESGWTRET